MVPVRPGGHIGHIKTDRRDATTLAALLRAGELTAIWVPDAAHEAMRDLSRGRQAAMERLRRARQQLLSFLLRHGRAYPTRSHWTSAHRRWLAEQRFEHAAIRRRQRLSVGSCRGLGQSDAQAWACRFRSTTATTQRRATACRSRQQDPLAA
jgi:transposase